MRRTDAQEAIAEAERHVASLKARFPWGIAGVESGLVATSVPQSLRTGPLRAPVFDVPPALLETALNE